MTTGAKFCFLLRIRPERVDDYLERHRTAWPELLEELRRCGYRNYSTFVDRSGLVVGYFEAEDPAGALDRMAATEVAALWSRANDDMFLPVDDERPVGVIEPLIQAFDLDRALVEASA